MGCAEVVVVAVAVVVGGSDGEVVGDAELVGCSAAEDVGLLDMAAQGRRNLCYFDSRGSVKGLGVFVFVTRAASGLRQ